MSTSGMGDAVRDGEVRAADLEDTIDAASPQDAGPVAAGLPAAIVAATRDYSELQPVERGHYAITRELARGGIGRVFEARDLRLGRQVAIKELLPKNRDAARRFEREARITARLQHPAIIHVYEAGVWPGGEPFYAMPLVSGRSLDKVVAERATLDERLGLLPNVIAVADALAYAHNANVIHRDLKPANVLVGDFGETVVIDWGLAKDLCAYSDPKESLQMRMRATADETMSGSVVGTPVYMAPEQARGDAVDQRADVYALGALLYKVLSGSPPYSGTTSQDVVDQVKSGPPVPLHEREPGAPPELVAIVAKAMARDPDDRYITASELAQDLKRFETGQLVGAHRYTIGELLRRWLRKHRVAVSIAVVALLALIVAGIFFVQRIVTEKQRADVARDAANTRRANLLEERGRAELRAGNAAAALAYLVGAAEDGKQGGARAFMIADAKRPFVAQAAYIDVGAGDVVLAVSPTHDRIATAGAGQIELHALDGTRVRTFGAHGTTRALAFDAAGTKLAAAGDDGIARVWSVDGALIAELPGRGAINAAVFSSDGRFLITGGDDALVHIWELATRRDRAVQCHAGPIVSLRSSPDGHRVLSASLDSTACITNIEVQPPSPEELSPRMDRQLKGHTDAVRSAEWSPDGTLVVTASDDGTARVWNADRGKPIVDSLRHEPGSVVQVALVTADGLVITAGSDLTVRLWDLPSVPLDGSVSATPAKLRRKLQGHTARVVTAALSADQRQLVTGGFDGVARIWDLDAGQEIATFEHGDAVSAVAFVPGSELLASGSRDGIAHVWSTKVAENRADLDHAIEALAVAPDGTLAAGLANSNVMLRTGSQQSELHGHLDSVLALAFTPAGDQLISAGNDAAAIVWDIKTRKQLQRLAAYAGDAPPPITALAVVPAKPGAATPTVALVRAGAVELWSLTSGARDRGLPTACGRIDALAVDPVRRSIAGVGKDGTFAVWNDARKLVYCTREVGAQYTAVAYAPDGTSIVTAGVGVGRVWTLLGGVWPVLDVTLESGMGIVRSVLVTPDGSRVITAGDNGVAMIWDRGKGKLIGTRDRHVKAITALALYEDTLWVGGEDQTLNAWDVHTETSEVGKLRQFMVDAHVPVELQNDDVVRKRP